MNDFDEISFSDNNDELDNIPFNNSTNDNNEIDNIPFNNIPSNNNTNLKDRILNSKKTTLIFPILTFIFIFILGTYIFISNSLAESINLIKIDENNKIGYINSDGKLIVKAKYITGTKFHKGYAIVKNTNNLYGVIDGKGNLKVPFGNYYYIGLFNKRYVASKITNKGLKQALLNEKLNNITQFKYDSISYSGDNIYLFVRDETMGLLNKDGKEIYTFKVDEVDDKNIDIEISKTSIPTSIGKKYAKIKVNHSSTIVNLSTGKEVYRYTLDDIGVLNNNIFYIKPVNSQDNTTYLVVKNNKIRLKTNRYKRVRIQDFDSDILIAINNDGTTSYINLDKNSVINENKNNDYNYGSSVVLEKIHDFNKNKDEYNIISKNGKIGYFDKYTPVDNIYSNNYLKVKVNNKYNYVNKKGQLLNRKLYDNVNNFNKCGYAIVNNGYTNIILNDNGKEITKESYNKIKFLNNDLFNNINKKYNKRFFIISDISNKYGIINDKDNVVFKTKYDKIKYITSNYPFVLGEKNNKYKLLNLDTGKELKININKNKLKINDGYIVNNKKYYNFDGKLIYEAGV